MFPRIMLFSIVRGVTVAFAALLPLLSQGQDFPAKPIRVVSPLPAGVGPEVEMRQIAARLSKVLGQSVLVENRPGAGGRIAVNAVITAPADGYTLLLSSLSTIIQQYVNKTQPYDMHKELTPVSLMTTSGMALYVSAGSPYQTLDQFIQAVKSRSGDVTMGTTGIGAAYHLIGEWFADAAGIQLRFIHYQTSQPYNDVARGEVSSVFETILPVFGLVKAGKLRPLAIAGKSRHRQFPEVPTFAEAGYPQFDPIVYNALSAPAKTPAAIVEKLSAAIAEVVRDPEFFRMSQERSREVIGSTPQEAAAFFDREHAKWSAIVAKTGLRLE